MATATLDISDVISQSGWTGATLANLSASDDVRATNGVAADTIDVNLENAPADFSSMSSIQLHVEARVVGSVSRVKTIQVELLDSSLNVLETHETNGLSSTEQAHNSSIFTRSDSKATVDGYRLRLTVLEGGGMGDSATVEIDRIWATLTYTPTTTVTGTGAINATLPTLSGAGERVVAGDAALTLPVPTLSGSGAVIDVVGTGAGNTPLPTINGAGTVVRPFIRFEHHETNTTPSNPTSFTSVPFGEAFAGRVLVVGIGLADSTGASGDITGVTIGGVTATKVREWGAGNSPTQYDMWAAVVPTGTSGTVTITYTQTGVGNLAMALWSVNNPANGVTAHDTATDSLAPYSLNNMDIPAGGGIIAAGHHSDGAARTITGIVEEFDLQVDGINPRWHHGGQQLYSTAQTGNSYPSDATSGGQYVAVSYGPTASTTVTGSGGVTAPVPTLSGTGEREVVGSGAIASIVPTLSAAGSKVFSGAGAIDAPLPTLSAAGERAVDGSAAIDATLPTLSSTGERQVTGAGAIDALLPTLTSAGERIVPGTGAIDATVPTLSSTGKREIPGSAALDTPVPALSGLGAIGGTVFGNAAISATVPTLSSSGKREIPGSAALDAPLPVIAATGERLVPASGAIDAPVPVLSASGERVLPGTGAIVLPTPLISSAGERLVDGAAAITAPVPTLAAAGSTDTVVYGTGAIGLPVPTLGATGTVTSSNFLTPVAPSPTGIATGSSSNSGLTPGAPNITGLTPGS